MFTSNQIEKERGILEAMEEKQPKTFCTSYKLTTTTPPSSPSPNSRFETPSSP
ncbi:MAG: hypothetical protein Q4D55_05500 [Eubacteriales bacterium]|nr:hypothetical protein [Eubacteriales bacterium]